MNYKPPHKTNFIKVYNKEGKERVWLTVKVFLIKLTLKQSDCEDMIKKEQIILNSVLPQELCCDSIVRFLHQLHLPGEKFGLTKWLSLYNPFLVLFLTTYFLILPLIVILVLPDPLSLEQEFYLHYAGDVSVGMNVRYHTSGSFVIFAYTVFLFFWIYWRGTRKQNSLRWHIIRQNIAPFRLLLGQCFPLEVGLVLQVYQTNL